MINKCNSNFHSFYHDYYTWIMDRAFSWEGDVLGVQIILQWIHRESTLHIPFLKNIYLEDVSDEFSGLHIQAQVHYLLELQGEAKQSFTELAKLYTTTPKFL